MVTKLHVINSGITGVAGQCRAAQLALRLLCRVTGGAPTEEIRSGRDQTSRTGQCRTTRGDPIFSLHLFQLALAWLALNWRGHDCIRKSSACACVNCVCAQLALDLPVIFPFPFFPITSGWWLAAEKGDIATKKSKVQRGRSLVTSKASLGLDSYSFCDSSNTVCLRAFGWSALDQVVSSSRCQPIRRRNHNLDGILGPSAQ